MWDKLATHRLYLAHVLGSLLELLLGLLSLIQIGGEPERVLDHLAALAGRGSEDAVCLALRDNMVAEAPMLA
jgi:hypothetical protein